MFSGGISLAVDIHQRSMWSLNDAYWLAAFGM
jgi:hypothetical protein